MTHRPFLSALLAAAGFAAAGLATIAAVPASAQDARLSSRPYRPDEIVRVEGKLNVQATIAFGEGEKIENVAVGDSESWQIAPNKRADLLFIKPLTETARTNMTVVTDRHTYFFDLVASPKAQPIYSLRFTYAAPAIAPTPVPALATTPVIVVPVPESAPATVAAVPAVATTAQPSPAQRRAEARRVADAAKAARRAEQKRLADQREAERQAARARAAAEAKRVADGKAAERAAAAAAPASAAAIVPAATPASPAAAPAWKRSGARELMPRTVYDDGRDTYAIWPAGQPLPQLLVADATGREVPVAFAVDGEKIVIPGLPGRIILRAGGKAGALESVRPAVAAQVPATSEGR